jgi:hypothetical protein
MSHFDLRAFWQTLSTSSALMQPCGARLLGFASAACTGGDHRWVIFWVVCLSVRCLLGCLGGAGPA